MWPRGPSLNGEHFCSLLGTWCPPFFLRANQQEVIDAMRFSAHSFFVGCCGRLGRGQTMSDRPSFAIRPGASRPGRKSRDRRDCRSSRYAAVAGETSGRTDWPLSGHHQSPERTNRNLRARRCCVEGRSSALGTASVCQWAAAPSVSRSRSWALLRLPDLLSRRGAA